MSLHISGPLRDSFVQFGDVLAVPDLKDAALRPSDQQSIEELDVDALAQKIISAGDPSADLLFRFLQSTRPDLEGDPVPEPPFVPSLADTRERINRSIALRRGQRSFRKKLIRRYDHCCMVSRCTLMDIVEAAHIWPYRGLKDNHPDNGLLLRADLHTLFDLDLMGIEPDSMMTSLHPKAASAGYGEFDGLQLHIPGKTRPSRNSLAERWKSFRDRV